MEGLNANELTHRLLTLHGRLSSGELARDAGVSRQTAHAVLIGLVGDCVAEAVGAGRGAHHVPAKLRSYRWDVDGLEEHRVWHDLVRDQAMETVPDPALSVLEYAVTEPALTWIGPIGSFADWTTMRLRRECGARHSGGRRTQLFSPTGSVLVARQERESLDVVTVERIATESGRRFLGCYPLA